LNHNLHSRRILNLNKPYMVTNQRARYANNPRLGTRPLGIALGNTLENGYFEIDIEPWKYEPLMTG